MKIYFQVQQVSHRLHGWQRFKQAVQRYTSPILVIETGRKAAR
jgi:hypothetical protein